MSKVGGRGGRTGRYKVVSSRLYGPRFTPKRWNQGRRVSVRIGSSRVERGRVGEFLRKDDCFRRDWLEEGTGSRGRVGTSSKGRTLQPTL